MKTHQNDSMVLNGYSVIVKKIKNNKESENIIPLYIDAQDLKEKVFSKNYLGEILLESFKRLN